MAVFHWSFMDNWRKVKAHRFTVRLLGFKMGYKYFLL
jgi:hypothetical protein